eukprot:c51454_g1_i1 orf=114-266(+)
MLMYFSLEKDKSILDCLELQLGGLQWMGGAIWVTFRIIVKVANNQGKHSL